MLPKCDNEDEITVKLFNGKRRPMYVDANSVITVIKKTDKTGSVLKYLNRLTFGI